MKHKNNKINEEIEKVEQTVDDKVDDIEKEKKKAFEKAKAFGERNKKKILYGVGTAGATVGGFFAGMFFERKRLEDDDDLIGDVVDEIQAEENNEINAEQ